MASLGRGGAVFTHGLLPEAHTWKINKLATFCSPTFIFFSGPSYPNTGYQVEPSEGITQAKGRKAAPSVNSLCNKIRRPSHQLPTPIPRFPHALHDYPAHWRNPIVTGHLSSHYQSPAPKSAQQLICQWVTYSWQMKRKVLVKIHKM